MYLTDYHCHSILSPDGHVPLADMAQAAVEAGLSEVCITDHCDLLGPQGGERISGYDWAPAVEQMQATAPVFQDRLKLKLGMELGSAHIDPAVTEQILAQPQLDFVIGSLHNVHPMQGGIDFYYLEYNTPADCYAALDDYFDSMEQLVLTPYYDVLGHIIYPLRYMHGLVVMDPYYDRIHEILRAAVQCGKGIEINTYRGRTVEDWRPVLERYKDVGGELITVGSDAHRPQDMALGIRDAYALLRDVGLRYVTVYDKRQPRMVAIA